jgi:hypothetical protein
MAANTDKNQTEFQEEFRVSGSAIVEKVREIIKEGNARRVIIKNEKDETIMELPLTVGAIGAILAPALAAVGGIAALVTNCKIIVIKKHA